MGLSSLQLTIIHRFHWAACQLFALRGCLDLPSLDDTLLSLPKDLNETYRRVLANIPDEYRRRAVRLLQFLTFAARPLRLEEAVDVVATFPEHTPAFQETSRIILPEEIVRYCSSLTKITTRKQGDRWNKADKEILTELQLAHFSVKEYLLSDHIEGWFKPEFTSCYANAAIVKVSLAYLFAASQDRYTNEVDSTLPLMQYVAHFWQKHAVLAEDDESAQTWIIRLLTERRAYEYWHSARAKKHGSLLTGTEGTEGTPDPLYYASLYGLRKSVKHLIENGVNVDTVGELQDSALAAASSEGHTEIVEMLLPKYAEIDTDTRELHVNDALQEASRRDHKNIVEILIRSGADVNAERPNWGFALCAASLAENEEIMGLLLHEGADIDASSDCFGTALQISSSSGSENIVKALLDKGANVNAQEGEYGTALYAAAVEGHKDIVEMLLNHNAATNLQGFFTNALYAAAVVGHEAIVDMLIDWGADVNAPGGEFSLPLAEQTGDEDDVADSNPLQAASYRGHEKIVKTLLDNGARVNAMGGFFGNALQAATYGRNRGIVCILIENGADVNAYGGYYGTAIHAASYEGLEEIVELLINKGADVNAPGGYLRVDLKGDKKDNHDSNALHAASFDGNEKVVKILLDNNAKVNAQGGHFGNALQAASYAGHEKIVSMLINRGAHVNAYGGYYGNALRAALSEDFLGVRFKSYQGREKVIQLLLSNGAIDWR